MQVHAEPYTRVGRGVALCLNFSFLLASFLLFFLRFCFCFFLVKVIYFLPPKKIRSRSTKLLALSKITIFIKNEGKKKKKRKKTTTKTTNNKNQTSTTTSAMTHNNINNNNNNNNNNPIQMHKPARSQASACPYKPSGSFAFAFDDVLGLYPLSVESSDTCFGFALLAPASNTGSFAFDEVRGR